MRKFLDFFILFRFSAYVSNNKLRQFQLQAPLVEKNGRISQ